MQKKEGYDFLKSLVGDLVSYIDNEKKKKGVENDSQVKGSKSTIYENNKVGDEVKWIDSAYNENVMSSPSSLSGKIPPTHLKMDGYHEGLLPGSIIDNKQQLDEDLMRESFSYPTMAKDINYSKGFTKLDTVKFRDNVREIDFILAFTDGTERQRRHRKAFHTNLEAEGLEVEIEDKSESETGDTYFAKVHAPWDFLTKYADLLRMKKPVKEFVMVRQGEVTRSRNTTVTPDMFDRFGWKNPFKYDESKIPPEPDVFTAGFKLGREDMFLIKDREQFFSSAQRSLMVWDILRRTKFSNKVLEPQLYGTYCKLPESSHRRQFPKMSFRGMPIGDVKFERANRISSSSFGISRLLANGTYTSAYPLHDGPYNRTSENGVSSARKLLYEEWGSPRSAFKRQPLSMIRRYFGDKMALYFAWLGFYTEMLIPAAIMGVCTFISGLFMVSSDFNKPSEEICNSSSIGNTTMCPLCDEYCYYWKLDDSCLNSKITFMVDNPITVFFSIAMSFWATMFLELWKRKQTVLQWQWDLDSYEDEEEIRPEYEESVRTKKMNPITRKKEPYLSFWNKTSRYVAANSVAIFMLFLVLAAVFGVILYRLVVAGTIARTNSELLNQNAKLLTSITAATINLCLILILNIVYEKIVVWLTNLELPRTQTEYEDSFTLKMFLFQSTNFYSSLIYIAFFKGRFFYHPGDEDARSNAVASLRYDMCDPAGCFFELFVQLAIIMVGKQFASNIFEILLPIARIWWNKRGNSENKKQVYTRWEQDYDLSPCTRLSLFYEYLEMVIQYGFVTLFVAAFPLAPLFALLNNIVEIRLDAYKYLTKSKRPLPQRVQDIGIWFGILKVITYASVVSNALVISYTSDFIPRLVYMYAYSPSSSLSGYIYNSLSRFNTSHFENEMGPDQNRYPRDKWPPICYYQAYRNPPEDDEDPYGLKLQFWHVFTARWAFIFIFEHVVIILTQLIASAIPDMPAEVKAQIEMEKKVEKEVLFETEMSKIRESKGKREPKTGDPFELDLGDGHLCASPAHSHISSSEDSS